MRKLKPWQLYCLQIGLFILTFIATTLAGAEHANFPNIAWGGFSELNDEIRANGITETGMQWFISWDDFKDGLWYSIPFLLILTVHEFGHYFMARYYKIKSSLPYYIPLWFPGMMTVIGTMGAVIRLRSATRTTKQFFDIGIAGPLAGWVVAICVIWYGFTNLPTTDYLIEVNQYYAVQKAKFGADFPNQVVAESQKELREATKDPSADLFHVGSNLTFWFFENYVVDESERDRIPNKYDMLHYPFLFAGFLALFFTALNLMPIGQLDGGHILYGLVGSKYHRIISPMIFTAFIVYAGTGMEMISLTHNRLPTVALNGLLYFGFLYLLYSKIVEEKLTAVMIAASIFTFHLVLETFLPGQFIGYPGFLLFGLLLSRLLGVYHPPALIEQKLDTKRQVLGWFALFVFIISFSPNPIN